MDKSQGTLSALYYLNQGLKRFPLMQPVLTWFKKILRQREHRLLEHRFQDLTVKNGPFRGLKYAAYEASCSAIFPKLLGCYEAELHPVLEEWKNLAFPTIVDIGCAEGYYAVGLAQSYPEAQVFAFDIDPASQKACKELAVLNNVHERVVIAGECSPKVLVDLPLKNGGLILSDCEGYEDLLFSQKTIEELSSCHILIEAHDFLKPKITEHMTQRLQKTHDVKIVVSLSDEAKVESYNYPEMEGMSTLNKRYAVAERRPAIMNWVVASPKS